jgi:hypothetical protein
MNILEQLKKAYVLSVSLTNGDTLAIFTEECDRYYSKSLTAAEMYQLIDELTAIADRMNIDPVKDAE